MGKETTLAERIAARAISKGAHRAAFDAKSITKWSWCTIVGLNEEFGYADDVQLAQPCSREERRSIEELLFVGHVVVERCITQHGEFYLAKVP